MEKKTTKKEGWMKCLVKERSVFQLSPLLLCHPTQRNMVPLSVYHNTALLPNTHNSVWAHQKSQLLISAGLVCVHTTVAPYLQKYCMYELDTFESFNVFVYIYVYVCVCVCVYGASLQICREHFYLIYIFLLSFTLHLTGKIKPLPPHTFSSRHLINRYHHLVWKGASNCVNKMLAKGQWWIEPCFWSQNLCLMSVRDSRRKSFLLLLMVSVSDPVGNAVNLEHRGSVCIQQRSKQRKNNSQWVNNTFRFLNHLLFKGINNSTTRSWLFPQKTGIVTNIDKSSISRFTGQYCFFFQNF